MLEGINFVIPLLTEARETSCWKGLVLSFISWQQKQEIMLLIKIQCFDFLLLFYMSKTNLSELLKLLKEVRIDKCNFFLLIFLVDVMPDSYIFAPCPLLYVLAICKICSSMQPDRQLLYEITMFSLCFLFLIKGGICITQNNDIIQKSVLAMSVNPFPHTTNQQQTTLTT